MLNSSSVCSLQLDRTKLGVLLNRKKSGQLFRAQIFIDKLLFTAWHLDFWCFNLLRFSNLVHMFSVVVRGRRYILQLQAWLRKLLWDGFWLLIFLSARLTCQWSEWIFPIPLRCKTWLLKLLIVWRYFCRFGGAANTVKQWYIIRSCRRHQGDGTWDAQVVKVIFFWYTDVPSAGNMHCHRFLLRFRASGRPQRHWSHCDLTL